MHLTSTIINFDDLTIEGSFASGSAITAYLFTTHANPWSTLLFSFTVGCSLGLITSMLHTIFSMNNLISGIITTTGVFSINLMTAGANVSLTRATIFTSLEKIPFSSTFLLSLVAVGIIFFISWILTREVGFLLRAVGCNPKLLRTLGKNITLYKTLGLVLANGFTALAGCLFVQYTGFFSITGSIGIMIIALASRMLSMVAPSLRFYALIVGAILYQAILALTLELNVNPVWNKLITASIIIALALGKKIYTKQQTLITE